MSHAAHRTDNDWYRCRRIATAFCMCCNNRNRPTLHHDNGTSFANILQQSQFGLSRPRSTQYVHCSVPVTHATQANDGPDRSRRLCTAFRMSCNGLTWTTELLCSTVPPYSMEHPGLLPKMPFAHGRLEEKPSLGLGEKFVHCVFRPCVYKKLALPGQNKQCLAAYDKQNGACVTDNVQPLFASSDALRIHGWGAACECWKRRPNGDLRNGRCASCRCICAPGRPTPTAWSAGAVHPPPPRQPPIQIGKCGRTAAAVYWRRFVVEVLPTLGTPCQSDVVVARTRFLSVQKKTS